MNRSDTAHADAPTFVYFILDRSQNAMKIGWSADPEARRKDLQVGNSTALEIVATAHGGIGDEQRLHAMWAEVKIRGEWFRATPKLLDYVERLRTGRAGLPTFVIDMPSGFLTLDELCDRHVRHVLEVCRGNKAQAARVLGIDRRAVYRWLARGAA